MKKEVQSSLFMKVNDCFGFIWVSNVLFGKKIIILTGCFFFKCIDQEYLYNICCSVYVARDAQVIYIIIGSLYQYVLGIILQSIEFRCLSGSSKRMRKIKTEILIKYFPI